MNQTQAARACADCKQSPKSVSLCPDAKLRCEPCWTKVSNEIVAEVRAEMRERAIQEAQ